MKTKDSCRTCGTCKYAMRSTFPARRICCAYRKNFYVKVFESCNKWEKRSLTVRK